MVQDEAGPVQQEQTNENIAAAANVGRCFVMPEPSGPGNSSPEPPGRRKARKLNAGTAAACHSGMARAKVHADRLPPAKRASSGFSGLPDPVHAAR